ncbi:MAG: mechanosensitive ion channel domain-containing protein [Pseudomonadota bacterium]
MSAEFKEIWEFVLFTVPGGESVTVGKLVLVLVLLIGGYLVSRFIGYLLGQRLSKTKVSPGVTHTIKRVTFFSLLVLVVLTALSLLGVPLTAFAFATGAIAIGVGFGAQNIINNFISGWILMAERPIRIDDFVEIDSTQGTVELIGTRSTRIRRLDGVHMLVPNSRLLEQTVTNWTLVDDKVRSSVRVGVAYGSPVNRVAELIMQAVVAQAEVIADPAPSVIFEDFGDNALIFDAFFWCEVGGEKLLRVIRSDIRFRISDLFEKNDITIAFPQRDVHLDSLKPIEVRVVEPTT